MVKYTKKVDEKISSLKRGNFSQKHKKILLEFNFDTIEPSIGFIVNQLQNFKKNRIIKVRNNYI
jgi:hypothetical protein